MKLDFSQFHPLDHWFASRRCFNLYGGPLRHAELWWTFKSSDYWHPDSYTGIVKCKFGHHTPQGYWKSVPKVGDERRQSRLELLSGPPTGYTCRFCHKGLPYETSKSKDKGSYNNSNN